MSKFALGFGVLVTVALALSCGGDGNDGPTGPPKTPLAGEVSGPAGAEPGDFVVYGGESSVPVDAEGRFTLPDTPQDTTLIVAVANGDETKPLLNLVGPQATHAALSLQTTALTMVLLSPEFATDDDERRARIAAAAESLPETAALASALETAYGQSGDPLDRPAVLDAWQRAINATGLALVDEGKSAPAPAPQGLTTLTSAGTEVTLYDLHSPLIGWEVKQPGGAGSDIHLKGRTISVLSWEVAAQEVDPGQWPDGFYGVHGVIWSTPLILKPNGYGRSCRVPGFSLSAWADFIGATVDAVFDVLVPSPGEELVIPGNRPGVYVIRSYNGASHKNREWDDAIRSWDRPVSPHLPARAGEFKGTAIVLNYMDAVFSVIKVALPTDLPIFQRAAASAALEFHRRLKEGELRDGELTETETVEAMGSALLEAEKELFALGLEQAAGHTLRATMRLLFKKLTAHLGVVAGVGRMAEILGGMNCGLHVETCIVPIEVSVLIVGDPWSGHEPAPDRVSDLAVAEVDPNSVTLRWTAPDPHDAGTRTCSAYDLRYSESTITEANWNNVRQVADEPSPPLSAGGTQTMTVHGLDDGRTYFFCLRAADMGANWSPLSNLLRVDTPAEHDWRKPGVIRNFQGEADGPYSATLRWIASGDDGYVGTAERYELHYSIGANWYVLYQFPAVLPPPKPANQPEVFALTGLTPETEYHFKIRVSDGHLWSELSYGFVNITTPPRDIVPPLAVNDLSATTIEGSMPSVNLRWTAPGDDEDAGRAAQYDLRYSEAPIDEENFRNATRVEGLAAPKPPDQPESFTVTGLQPSRTYWFALKVADEVPNWSGLSNVVPGRTADPPDVTPPAKVTTLVATGSTHDSVTLGWTAVGDDGTAGGAATSYDLRYSTAVITAANFASATQVTGEPAPKASGQAETFTVTGLQASTTYYFALKVADEVPNWGELSNVPSRTTQGTPVPAPAFVGDVTVSPTPITLGQTVTITAKVRNDGAASGYGGISISFSDLNGTTDESQVQCTSPVNDAPGHQTYAKQETISNQNCQPIPAQYLLAEYGDNAWAQSEENTYTVVVTPKATGIFDIYVRCALKVGTDPQICAYVPALPPNGTAGAIDQQGWPVKRWEVRVDPAPPPPGDMIRINPGTVIG